MGRHAKTAVIGYQWQSDTPLGHEREATALLDRAVKAGVVSQWDGDTGWRCVWVNGWPGPDMRALRDQLVAWWGPSRALTGLARFD